MKLMSKVILIYVCFLLAACASSKKPYYSDGVSDWNELEATEGKALVHSLYLIGDAGSHDNVKDSTNYVLGALQNMIKGADDSSSLVYLGNNVSPKGLPKKKDKMRSVAERVLNAQLKVAGSFDGKTYFIPGNHDWNNDRKGGLKAINRQEKYVQEYFEKGDKRVKFYPSDGCGDPKVHKVNKDLVFVFIDTQWWLQDWSNEKDINQGCDIKSKGDFLKSMQEIFTDHKNDEIVVLMHHPIKSNGTHGGKFSWKHHLFPMHEKGLWIPLPIIGSAYPIFRNVTGTNQDISNVNNADLMQELAKMAKALRIHVVFASGHEKGLQYFDEDKLKYIVSGSGSKVDYLRKGKDATFLEQSRGFAKIDFYEDFEAWVSYFRVDKVSQKPELAYKTQIREPRPGTIDEQIKYPPLSTHDTLIAANEVFEAGAIKKFFMGSQYRDMWATPVSAPIIDLENTLGGLTPIKKGGGMASNSLRMEKADGKQYILRSIKKDYTKLVPPGFENHFVIDIMADQNSASHPYSALIIPTLSKAAGVYYTNPKLVYLKHQRGLGNYNSQFPEELYLLEERPTGDWSDASQFGNSSEIIGYTDLLVTLREKKHHRVDQAWVAKSRVFDLLIHDWDRHDDQWRWASFEEGDNTIYRPIPRDRDQAFYKFVGVVPTVIAAFPMKKFKTMKKDLKDVKNHSFNAKHFDRYFLNDLEWSEWSEVVSQLQQDITDEVIEESMNGLPKEVRHLNDKELIEKLISRRDHLQEIAKRLYDFISKEVDVTGSDNDDRFFVNRHANGTVTVEVYTKAKGDDVLRFDRTFYPNETKEVRLYGLRGKDKLELKGDDNGKIKLRFIGGEDKDHISNLTNSNIYVYDEKKGLKIDEGSVKDKRSDDLEVNEYDRHAFSYNGSSPIVYFGTNQDQDFWIGMRGTFFNKGWRKEPYKSKQRFKFRVAPGGQNAFSVGWKAHFPDAFGHLDFAPNIDVEFPRIENWFGLGNETKTTTTDIPFNWVKIQTIDVKPLIKTNLGGIAIDVGPAFESYRVQNVVGRVSDDSDLGFAQEAFERRNYFGLNIENDYGYQDAHWFPTNGFHFNLDYKILRDFSLEETVSTFGTNMTFYMSLLNAPKVVLASKVGYEKVFGDIQFHQFVDLGNDTNLRGYRNNRFRGQSGFYQNLDLRMKLFTWKNSVLPMGVGVMGGYDYGRVWVDNEDSSEWHTSMTAGLWFNFLGAIVLNPYYTWPENETDSFTLQVGFSF
jgi:hypothetical protein